MNTMYGFNYNPNTSYPSWVKESLPLLAGENDIEIYILQGILAAGFETDRVILETPLYELPKEDNCRCVFSFIAPKITFASLDTLASQFDTRRIDFSTYKITVYDALIQDSVRV